MRGTLDTGDYSIAGLTHVIAVERKSLQDLVMCVGRERERFERELQRLKAYPVSALVIEAKECQILLKQYRGEVHPNAVMGSVISWEARGLKVKWLGNAKEAGDWTARFMFAAARDRYLENYPLFESVGSSREILPAANLDPNALQTA